ncbi:MULTISPECIES: bifunctional diguanylate cyclase/phosphodiesterase [Ferrimonas]|uniref:putative bifunctional diguanylate cyclase/phosphodiesterase n=1 Tax=Ferrimonas TaxID=44011 RepID=UPI0003F682E7|nr:MULTISPECIES: phosphodiesterase [Ferrimonas]USD38195.1 phosphodiesterase [Ferrimonas sp. SCSIO 43195]
MQRIFARPLKWQLTLVFAVIMAAGTVISWRLSEMGLRLDDASANLVQHKIPELNRIHQLRYQVLELKGLLVDAEQAGISVGLQQQIESTAQHSTQLLAELQQQQHRAALFQELQLASSQLRQWTASPQSAESLPQLAEISELLLSVLDGVDLGLMNDAGDYQQLVHTATEGATRLVVQFLLLLWLAIALIAFLSLIFLREHRRRKRLSMFPEHNPDPALACDYQLTLTYHNPAFDRLAAELGFDCAKEMFRTLLEALNYRDSLEPMKEHRLTFYGRTLAVTVVMLDELERIHMHIKDVSEAQQVQELMEHRSNHDFLTGLPNRRRFEHDIDYWLTHQSCELVVGMLHLDRFQRVTSAVGFGGGDGVLIRATEILSNQLQKLSLPDQPIALYRFESTRFAMLWVGSHRPEAVSRLAEKVKSSFQQPVVCGRSERQFFFSLSQGFSSTTSSIRDAGSLIRDADCAASRAVHEGGDRVRFHSEAQSQKEQRKLRLEQDLRYALERNELKVYYQQQCCESEFISAAEALLRWQHPQLGMIPPDEFIELAEQSGQIIEIGEWVLQQACEQVKSWNREGRRMGVAINVSVKQLVVPQFVDSVKEVLALTKVDPSLIEFELTESMLMENLEAGKQAMLKIKALGVRFAIDDFGTGHSSLAYLSQLPFDVLKIDHSFVKQLPRDPHYCKVTKAILSLAKNLGLTVVAEGVEHQDQMRWLRQHGCDLMQGYLLGKPVTVPEFRKLLALQPVVH